MDLKYYLENTSTQTSKNKIFQLLNSPVFKEKIENFKSKKTKSELFYPKDEFKKALEIAKDKLKKIIHKKGTEVEYYFEKQFDSNEIFEINKDHIIFFITDLLFVYEEEEDLYLFPFFLFIIDDYLKKIYGEDGLKDVGIGSKRIEIELSNLSFLADKFLKIGNFDIKFYSPGDTCRNFIFTNKSLKNVEKFIYFEEESVIVDDKNFSELFPDFFINSDYFKTESKKYIDNIIYLKKNNKIYRLKNNTDTFNLELVEIKPYYEDHDYYKQLKDILPDSPSTLTFEDYGNILDDYGKLHHLDIKNLYIYGVMKFDDYISMKDTSSSVEDSNFKIPNIRGINLIDNLSESKFSKENKLLNGSKISFSEMSQNILKIDDKKQYKILLITGCGNYDYKLCEYYKQLDEGQTEDYWYDEKCEYKSKLSGYKNSYKKYIDNLGRVREPFIFEKVLEEIEEKNKKIKEINIKLDEFSELKDSKEDSERNIKIIESKIMGLNKNKIKLEEEIKLLEENKTMPYTGLKPAMSRSNSYFSKYYINNQNDYSIDIAKPIENSLSSYKDYKSLYYKYKKKYLNLKNKILIPVGK